MVPVAVQGIAFSGCQAYYPSPGELEEYRNIDSLRGTDQFDFRGGRGREDRAPGDQ